MSESEAPPAVEESRNFFGWCFLGLILLAMFVESFGASLVRKPQSEKATPDSYEVLLEQEVSQLQLISALSTDVDSSTQELRQKTLATLKEPISDLVPEAKKDPQASRMYAAMRTEVGDPVPPESLAPLLRSHDPKDEAFARIYTAAKLSKADAQRLADALPNQPFLYQLAKVHALEKAGDKEARGRAFTGRRAIGVFVMGIGAIGVFAGSIVAWTLYLRARREKLLKPVGYPVGAITLADADRLAMRAAQILALFQVFSIAALFLRVGAAAAAIPGVAIIATVFWLSKFPVDGKRISVQAVGLSTQHWFRHIGWGIGGFLVEFPISLFLAALGAALFSFLPAPTHPAVQELSQAKDVLSKLPLILFATISAPIWEEFVFRGLLFPALGRVIGRVMPAAIATGFIFAMIHPQGIAFWFGLASVGTMGCALTYHTRSLIPTIVMHMLHNTAMVALLLLMTAPV